MEAGDHIFAPVPATTVPRLLEAILAELKLIGRALGIGVATYLSIHWGKPQPPEKGITQMPAQLTDTQSIPASISETDAAGQIVTINPATVTWTVNNPSIVALTQNSDGSATFKALAVGTTGVGVTDSSNGLSAQDTLTVTAGAATSLVIAFGQPS